MLLVRFLLQLSECRETVFDFLKRCQYGLSITRARRFVIGYCGARCGTAMACVKDALCSARAESPEAAGPSKQVGEMIGVNTRTRRKQYCREECRPGDAYLLVGCGHPAFGGSNIWPAFK